MNIRLRLGLLLVGILIIGIIYSFPVWQGLFGGEQVIVALRGLPQAYQALFLTLPPAQQSTIQSLHATDTTRTVRMVEALLASTDAVVPTELQGMPTMIGPVLVLRSTFTGINSVYWAEGDVLVYQQPDNVTYLRLENFRSARAPDVRVVLWSQRFPGDEDNGDDMMMPLVMTEAEYDVGALWGNVGDQGFFLPPEIDLNQYHSVVIYSRALMMILGIAPL